MTVDIYSGKINWNRIYRCFHSPNEIASHIKNCFPNSSSSMLFAGFPEVASILCECGFRIRFFEFSNSMAMIAKSEFPKLSVETGNIVQAIALDQAVDVAIVCRISAYWDSKETLLDLVSSLKRFPRRRVLIDFYDRDLVEVETHVSFLQAEGTGYWKFLGFNDVHNRTPLISIAEMDVSYSFGDINLNYIAHRAFFKKQDLLKFFKNYFPEANVKSLKPLIPSDPSFTIIIEFSDQI